MEQGDSDSLHGVELTLLVRWTLVVGTSGRGVPPSLIFVRLSCQMITFVCGNLLLEMDILGLEALVLLLETLGYGLESNVAFDVPLLIELDACLKFSKL